MKLPSLEKPIEKIYVQYAGDSSAGFRPVSFELACFLDVNTFSMHTTVRKELELIKQKISDLYESLNGEKPDAILFDYEVE
jgi:hypothetical protein